jgi:hypothetical protein
MKKIFRTLRKLIIESLFNGNLQFRTMNLQVSNFHILHMYLFNFLYTKVASPRWFYLVERKSRSQVRSLQQFFFAFMTF